MPLQTSGPISIENIRNQIGLRPGDFGSRSLVYLSEYVGFSAPHAMSDFYGYPPYPPYGTYYSAYCDGCTYYNQYHDGYGGFYSEVFEYNSPSCGCGGGGGYYCAPDWAPWDCGIYQSPCWTYGYYDCFV